MHPFMKLFKSMLLFPFHEYHGLVSNKLFHRLQALTLSVHGDQPLFETFPDFTLKNCSCLSLLKKKKNKENVHEHFYANKINIIKFHTISHTN